MGTDEKVVYSADDLDVVIEKPAAKSEKEQKKEEEVEEELEEDPGKDQGKKEVKAEKEEKADDAEEEEEVEEEEKKEDDADEIEIDDDQVNSIIEQKLGEKYEITSFEELEETLDAIDALSTKNEELQKELAEAKKGTKDPVFETEAHKKAFDFIKDAPKQLHGERLLTWAELNNIDVDNGDPKFILRQEFIIKHPELTREEATNKFERKYKKNYTVNADEFEDEKALKEETDDKASDLKMDAAKAKEFLKKTQKEFKSDPKDKEETPKENEAIKMSVTQNAKEAEAFLNKFKEINIEDGEEKVSFKLTDKHLKDVRGAMMAWINNPAGYNEKGELSGFDPEQSAIRIALYMFPEEVIREAMRQSKTSTAVKKIEEIAGNKPSRKAKGADAGMSSRSEEDQWNDMLKNKELKDKKRRQFA